jgi:hypothetical protein
LAGKFNSVRKPVLAELKVSVKLPTGHVSFGAGCRFAVQKPGNAASVYPVEIPE